MNNQFFKNPVTLIVGTLFSTALLGICIKAEDNVLTPRQFKIEKFLKANYCEVEEPAKDGASTETTSADQVERDMPPPEEEPAEPGEENFCLIKRNIEINSVIKVLADDKIEIKPPAPENPGGKFIWNVVRDGKLSPEIKEIVYKKLLGLRLPREELGNTLFQAWKIKGNAGSYENIFIYAFYKKLNNETELKGHRCELTLALDKKTRKDPSYSITTFNKIPYKEVDFEVDSDVQKVLYDIRDVDNDKKFELILFAEGYEASWLEVYSKKPQGWYLGYKGLGYSL